MRKSTELLETEAPGMERIRTLMLRTPVALGEKSYELLELREPTVGEFEQAGKAVTSIGADLELLAQVTKIPVPALRKIGVQDYRTAMEFLRGFTDPSPATGDS